MFLTIAALKVSGPHPRRIHADFPAYDPSALPPFFREYLVKLCEPGMSSVWYHCRGGLGKRPVSFFLSLPENSATGDRRAEQHSQREGDERATIRARQLAPEGMRT
jgi:hypothetical protein